MSGRPARVRGRIPAPGRPANLPLRVLWTATGFAAADLLTLDFASVAGDEPGIAKRLAQSLVVLHQGAGDAVADRAGLAGDAATVDTHADVELVRELHSL